MYEGIIIKVPDGFEPLAIRRQWVLLRFVFEQYPEGNSPSRDAITGAPLPPRREFGVAEEEAFRIMDAQRPGMSAFYRKHTLPDLKGWDFTFGEDEIHFLDGTESAWG